MPLALISAAAARAPPWRMKYLGPAHAFSELARRREPIKPGESVSRVDRGEVVFKQRGEPVLPVVSKRRELMFRALAFTILLRGFQHCLKHDFLRCIPTSQSARGNVHGHSTVGGVYIGEFQVWYDEMIAKIPSLAGKHWSGCIGKTTRHTHAACTAMVVE